MIKKKGVVFQIFIALIILFVAALVGILFLVMTNNVNHFWLSSGALNSTVTGTNAINKINTTAPLTTDYAILFLFIGLNIGLVVSAVKTNFSPLIIVLFIFLVFIAIFISAGMVNMYHGLADSSSVIGSSGDLHFTNFLFSKYLPLIICIISAFLMLIMFGKSGGDIPQ